MATQEYLYPKVPVRNSDGVISAVDQENFNRSVLELFRSKVSKDNQNSSSSNGVVGVVMEDYVKQIVQNHVILPYSYAYTATRANAVEIACLTTSITTAKVDSKIAIDIALSSENSVSSNSIYILERVVGSVATEIGSHDPTSASSRYYGIVSIAYDNDLGSTMAKDIIQYIDSPEVAAGTTITYRLKVYGTAQTIYINRTKTDTDSDIYERATSNVRLTEFGGTPVVSTDTTDIATVAEAIAGTNDTKIITPLKLRKGLNAGGSAPIYACRAWVNFDGTLSSGDLRRGYGNVSSITDGGTGKYTINFTTAMEDANFCIAISLGNNSTMTTSGTWAHRIQSITTTYAVLWTARPDGAFYDANIVSLSVFR